MGPTRDRIRDVPICHPGAPTAEAITQRSACRARAEHVRGSSARCTRWRARSPRPSRDADRVEHWL